MWELGERADVGDFEEEELKALRGQGCRVREVAETCPGLAVWGI